MRGQSQSIVARREQSTEVLQGRRPVIDSLLRKSVFSLLARLTRGMVIVIDDNEQFVFGEPGDLSVTITVHDPSAYRALAIGGSVGAGEAYMSGVWSCDDLAILARIFARNSDTLGAMEGGAAWASRLVREVVAMASRRNTRAGSRRNIARHYDLSNDFFALFLDDSMTYSSAIFESPSATLEEAQRSKIDRVCKKLDLGPGDHLLEIGTGWGALAMHAASEYGCRVTTTTVSAEQHRLARARVRARGLDSKIEVLLRDYRDVEGQFDKLVSIEMIEAVGHEFLEPYFRACSERLTPGGQALFQAITMADQHHEQHRSSVDFIKEYIFPGSCLPSVTSMVSATTRATDLRLFDLEDLTPHYARTLREWRKRFLDRSAKVRELGFDDTFIRMWEYYLAYCEGGFEERYLGAVQVLFTKPDSRRGPISPRRH